MKTKYATIKFKRGEGPTWCCLDREGDVLGSTVQNMTTSEWRFLSLGSVFLCRQTCLDIANFLDQLHEGGKT